MGWEFPEYPENWSEIQRKVKERDNWTCQECGQKGGEGVNLNATFLLNMLNG